MYQTMHQKGETYFTRNKRECGNSFLSSTVTVHGTLTIVNVTVLFDTVTCTPNSRVKYCTQVIITYQHHISVQLK